MSVNFQDIRITGLDSKATQQSPTAPGLRLMYLTLSGTPPHMWTQIFDAERQFPRHSMWRTAEVEGDNIVVDCVPEELEQYHLRDLKEDVRNTNEKYRGYLTHEEQRIQNAQEAAERDLEAIPKPSFQEEVDMLRVADVATD